MKPNATGFSASPKATGSESRRSNSSLDRFTKKSNGNGAELKTSLQRAARRIDALEQAIANRQDTRLLEILLGTSGSRMVARVVRRLLRARRSRGARFILVATIRRAPQLALLASGLFDEAYYRSQNPDTCAPDESAVLHYLRKGAAAGLQPHPLFDPAFYAEHNPVAVNGHLDPLIHYLVWGASEDRQPHPLFDSVHYRRANPDVPATVGALEHYLRFGAAEGRNPHPLFDSAFYLSSLPPERRAGLNPLVHYLRWGAQEGLNPHPGFDTSFYVKANPDVVGNPLEHYVKSGEKEGRAPSPSG